MVEDNGLFEYLSDDSCRGISISRATPLLPPVITDVASSIKTYSSILWIMDFNNLIFLFI